MRHFFLLAALLLFPAFATAQTARDAAAAQETYIEGLRLVDTAQFDLPATAKLEKLGTSFGYTIADTMPGNGQYFCAALPTSDIRTVSQQVTRALLMIPEQAYKKVGLKHLILCRDTRAGNLTIGGIPVPPLSLLMLNTGGDPSKLISLTLHEYYHLAEYRLNQFADAEWDKQFTGYSNSYGSTLTNGPIGSGGPTFLNAYAKSFPHEERAELFVAMMLKPRDLLLYIKEKDDRILLKKLLYMNKKCQAMLGFTPITPKSE